MTTFLDSQVSDIQDLCLCILSMRNEDIKDKLKLELYNLVVECKRNNENTLTDEELRVGQCNSKIQCVKLFKERTGRTLMDAKKTVEKYFEENGYKFYNPSCDYQ